MRVLRPHPILAVQFSARYLSLLIIPALRSIFVLMNGGAITALIFGQVVGFLLILTLSIIKFYRTEIVSGEEFLIFKSGIFIQKVFKLGFSEVGCLRVKINPLKRLLRTANVKFYTDAAKKRADFDITIRGEDLKILEKNLEIGDKSPEIVSYARAANIVIYALSTSSIVLGAVTLWPIISLASEVFERNFSQEIYSGIGEVSRPLSPILPGVLAVLLSLLTVILFFSFAVVLFKHSHLKAQAFGEFMMVKSGFLTLFKTYVRGERINAIQISKTPLLGLFRRKNVAIHSPIGVSDTLKSQIVLPASSDPRIINNFCEKLLENDEKHDKKILMTKKGRVRFYRFAILVLGYIFGGAVVLRLLPHSLQKEFAVVTFLAILLVVAWYVVRCRAAKSCEIVIGEKVMKSVMLHGFTVKEIRADIKKIAIIKSSQNPFDKHLGVYSVKIFISNARVVKCRMVNILQEDLDLLASKI